MVLEFLATVIAVTFLVIHYMSIYQVIVENAVFMTFELTLLAVKEK
ncbi:hypothetical protein ACIQ57_15530 [Lysinibacillus xylanilyticus]